MTGYKSIAKKKDLGTKFYKVHCSSHKIFHSNTLRLAPPPLRPARDFVFFLISSCAFALGGGGVVLFSLLDAGPGRGRAGCLKSAALEGPLEISRALLDSQVLPPGVVRPVVRQVLPPVVRQVHLPVVRQDVAVVRQVLPPVLRRVLSPGDAPGGPQWVLPSGTALGHWERHLERRGDSWAIPLPKTVPLNTLARSTQSPPHPGDGGKTVRSRR